jgi:methylmalonyl-CoA mutase cobalamin-binding subunit
METIEKKQNIKSLVVKMLNESHDAMLKKIDNVLNSGGINIDSWDINDKPMILPKIITMALLEHEIHQYDGSGTSYQKRIKKEVRNLRYFI